MEDEHRERQIGAAENQALFRNVNARIEEVNRLFDVFTPFASWTCECWQIACIERIDMTLEEYAAVREKPTTFAVYASDDHFEPRVEDVLQRHERYWVVEKIGAAAERATELSEGFKARCPSLAPR
jgi:hypothetical protein